MKSSEFSNLSFNFFDTVQFILLNLTSICFLLHYSLLLCIKKAFPANFSSKLEIKYELSRWFLDKVIVFLVQT